MFENFKEEFLKTVQEEVDSPEIKVLILKVGEPVSDEIIEKVESKLGFPLDESIKSFYKQCNGIIYRAFEVKPDIAAKGTEKGKIWSTDFIDWGKFCDDNKLGWISDESIRKNGSIRHIYIRPLEDVFLGPQYLVEDDEEEDDLYLFDAWYYYYPIMLHTDKENKTIKVVAGDDYGACYTTYERISFEEYIEQFLTPTFSHRFFGNYQLTAFNIE